MLLQTCSKNGGWKTNTQMDTKRERERVEEKVTTNRSKKEDKRGIYGTEKLFGKCYSEYFAK